MNKEEIIRMARECGFTLTHQSNMGIELYLSSPKDIEMFVQLIEKRKCKELSDKIAQMPFGTTSDSFAVWVKEQGENPKT